MNRNNYFSHQKGMSTLAVVATLIVSFFIGTAMVTLVSSDRFGEAFYASSARSAAQAGIIASVQKLESSNPTTQILPLLQECIESAKSGEPTTQWISGGSDNNYLQIGGSNLRYRTKITHFDTENFTITLVCEGVGSNNARAIETAVYQLNGLEFQSGNVPSNAIQMDNGSLEIGLNLLVSQGTTSIKGGMAIRQGSATFEGPFRSDSLKTSASNGDFSTQRQSVRFKKNAYFATAFTALPREDGSNSAIFEGDVGFDGPVNFEGNSIKWNGSNVYAKANMINQSADTVDFTGKSLYYDSSSLQNPAALFSGGTFNPSNETVSTLFLLGMSPEPDPEINFDLSKISTIHRVIDPRTAPQITAAMLNSWYGQERDKSNLFGGTFLVLKIQNLGASKTDLFKYEPTHSFKGKAIIIVENAKHIGGSMVRTADDGMANLTFYICQNKRSESKKDQPIFGDTPFIRGFVYVKGVDDGSNLVVTLNDSTKNLALKGSIYGSSKSMVTLTGGATKTFDVQWDGGVVNDLVALGVFSNPENPAVSTLKLKANFANLTADAVR